MRCDGWRECHLELVICLATGDGIVYSFKGLAVQGHCRKSTFGKRYLIERAECHDCLGELCHCRSGGRCGEIAEINGTYGSFYIPCKGNLFRVVEPIIVCLAEATEGARSDCEDIVAGLGSLCIELDGEGRTACHIDAFDRSAIMGEHHILLAVEVDIKYVGEGHLYLGERLDLTLGGYACVAEIVELASATLRTAFDDIGDIDFRRIVYRVVFGVISAKCALAYHKGIFAGGRDCSLRGEHDGVAALLESSRNLVIVTVEHIYGIAGVELYLLATGEDDGDVLNLAYDTRIRVSHISVECRCGPCCKRHCRKCGGGEQFFHSD